MSVMFRRLVYTIVGLAFLLLAGCGGGADAPFVVTGNPANQPSQVVSNESLLGLYNSLSVGYGTRSTAEPVQVFNQDILYNLIGFKTAAPSLFLTNPVRLIDYNFAASNLGIGALTVETSVGNANSRVNVPVYTVPDGGLAVFGVPSALISTPVFSAQMKAVFKHKFGAIDFHFLRRLGLCLFKYEGFRSGGSAGVCSNYELKHRDVHRCGFPV